MPTLKRRFLLVPTVVLLVILVVSLAACLVGRLADPPKLSRGLMAGDPCEAPCWYGLVPGQSREDEVRQRIRSLDFIDTSSLREQSNSGTLRLSWITRSSIIRPLGSKPGTFELSQGILRKIILAPDDTIELKSILQKFGPPSKYDAHRDSNTDRYVFHAVLYYPAHGLILSIEFVPVGSVSPTTIRSDSISLTSPLNMIIYQPAMTLDELKNELASTGGQYVVDQWQDWK